MTKEQAARVREYERGYRDGHIAGYADALLGQTIDVIPATAGAAIQWRPGYADGYRAGNRAGRERD